MAAKLTAADLRRAGLAVPRTRAKAARKPGPGSGDLAPLHPGDVLIALDVSSTRTGHARVTIGPRGECILVDCGAIRPKATLPPWERIDAIADACLSLCSETPAARIVLEWAEGKFRGRQAASHGGALAALGHSQGACRDRLVRAGFAVELIGDLTWTRALDTNTWPKKSTRARWVAREYAVYRRWAVEHGDSSFDTADAVGIACWRVARARGEAGIDWRAAR